MQVVPLPIHPAYRDVQPILVAFVFLIRAGLECAGRTMMMNGAEVEPVRRGFTTPGSKPFNCLFRCFLGNNLPRAHACPGFLWKGPCTPAAELNVYIEPDLAFAIHLLVGPPEKGHDLMPHLR